MNAFREWLNALFGSDGGRAVQMLFALLLVVLLILAVTWLFRRLFGTTFARGRSARLSVVDSTPIDPRRRLLLVRRDDVEHLVMVGGPNDLLVESRILRAPPVIAGRAAAQAPAMPQRAPVPRPPIAPEPEPVPVPATPAAAAIEALEETPSADPAAARFAAARTRAAAGVATAAAGMASAVASAGALLRARMSRPEEESSAVSQAAETIPTTPRRTLDEAFDTPLGRPDAAKTAMPPMAEQATEKEPAITAPIEVPAAAAPVPPIVEPPAPAVAEAVRASVLDRPILERPMILERPVVVPPIEPPPAPVVIPTVAAPVEPVAVEPAPVAAPRPFDDIDLFADFAAITAELSSAASATAGRHEPVRPEPAPVVEPVIEPPAPEKPVAEPDDSHFHFDFDFAPTAAAVVPPVEPPRVEPVLEAPTVVAVEPEPEPVPVEPILVEPEPEPVAPEAAAHEPASAAPEVRPPAAAPAPAQTTVDELEEEMARLLAELSGQTRR